MANEIRIVISADDRASTQLKKVQSQATATASSIEGKLTASLAASTGSMIKFATAASGVYFGILGISQVIGRAFNVAISGAIDESSNLTESINKNRVVFGDWSKDIEDFATDSTRNLLLSKQAAIESASTFGNLFVAMGANQPQAAKLSTELVTLAQDLSSFNNIPTDEALVKLRAGLVGEFEPLRTLGVQLSADAIEAEGLARGFRKANEELTPLGKALTTYQLIMEKTKTAQGDAARTSGDFANNQRALRANIDDLQAKIGTALVPVVNDLVSKMRDWIALNGDQVAADFAEAVDRIVPVAENAAQKVRDIVAAIDELSQKQVVKVSIDIVAGMSGDQLAITVLGALMGFKVGGPVGAVAVGGAAVGGAMLDQRAARGEMMTPNEAADYGSAMESIAISPFGPGAKEAQRTIDQIHRDMALRKAMHELSTAKGTNNISVEDMEAAQGAADQKVAEANAAAAARGERVPPPPGGATSQSKGGSSAAAKSPVENAWDSVLTALNKKVVEAFDKGGADAARVVADRNKQIVESVAGMAERVSAEFGIPLEDAIGQVFSNIDDRAKSWATAMERIQNDSLHKQIDAYLKGGEAALNAEKMKNQTLLDEAAVIANTLSNTLAIPVSDLATRADVLATVLGRISTETDKTRQSFGNLLSFMINRRAGTGMPTGLRGVGFEGV